MNEVMECEPWEALLARVSRLRSQLMASKIVALDDPVYASCKKWSQRQ
jgi:hypothetical protein